MSEQRAIEVRGASLAENRVVMAAVMRMRPHRAAARSNDHGERADIQRQPAAGESPAEIKPYSAR